MIEERLKNTKDLDYYLNDPGSVQGRQFMEVIVQHARNYMFVENFEEMYLRNYSKLKTKTFISFWGGAHAMNDNSKMSVDNVLRRKIPEMEVYVIDYRSPDSSFSSAITKIDNILYKYCQ
jgi:hypothetical protein